MVNPLLMLAVALGVGFIFAWLRPYAKTAAWTLLYGALVFGLAVSIQWLTHFVSGGVSTTVLPGGFSPPVGIALGWGMKEAFISSIVFLGGLLGSIALFKTWRDTPSAGPVLFLLTIAGSIGLIMSRDLFNLFVFLEITSMSTAGLLATGRHHEGAVSGFKMMLVTGLASVLFLIGTVYLYRITGTLAIDQILVSPALAGTAGFTASFLIIAAILVELKIWPANGWALDVLTSAHPVIAALISTVHSVAILFVFYKIFPLLPPDSLLIFTSAGLMTFVSAHLAGLRQDNFQRMLAYSSVGMMGLFVTVITWTSSVYGHNIPIRIESIILGGFIITHLLAKGGLFWVVAHFKDSEGNFDITRVGSTTLGGVIITGLILALAGLPPFPSFWAKWTLIREIAASSLPIVFVILLGALFEVINLFRWLGRALEGESHCAVHAPPVLSGIALFSLGGFSIGAIFLGWFPDFNISILIPFSGLIAAGLVAFLPNRIQISISILILGLAGFALVPGASGIGQAYTAIILGSGALMLLTKMEAANKDKWQLPLIVGTVLTVAVLGAVHTALEFWTSWEMMTAVSALLIVRGKNAKKSALMYWTFSMAGAFLLLAGLALAVSATGQTDLSKVFAGAPSLSIILISLGFLFKAGVLGVHIWVPDAYAESEDDSTPYIAALVSKAPIIGLILVFYYAADAFIGPFEWRVLIGWIGVLTAFFGALFASFQEDVKKLLAYSSMGQIGYIIAVIALGSYTGWVAALYLALHHILYKGLLFITIAGVISRTQTSLMYKMGGLIKRMPLSFVAVLMSIIAISGVPPLPGFGGKWMMYSAFIEAGWTLQAGVAFFASGVAFLYLYRLIHTVFLGMPKNEHINVKESSIWRLVPMYIIIAMIMGIATMPKLLLEPIMNLVQTRFPATMHWEAANLISSLGSWNGNAIMMVTMGVFMLPLILLLFRVRGVKRVKPFNIVYAAEKPERPETTHVAHNFFAHYRRAIGVIALPRATAFWRGVAEWTDTLGDWVRQWATGNGQTYAVQVLLFVSVLYFFMRQTAL
ncbi:hypothetical protein KAR48_08355 [bacterium]|nr:hypothetical protein [bacterium]